MSELFHDTTNMRTVLIFGFYSQPNVLEDLNGVIRSYSETFSNTCYVNGGISIQLKKTFLRKTDIDIQNSFSYYTLLNQIFCELFDIHKPNLLSLIREAYPVTTDPEIMFNRIKQHVNMMYNITLLPDGNIILYL